jgi:hypothetical protein
MFLKSHNYAILITENGGWKIRAFWDTAPCILFGVDSAVSQKALDFILAAERTLNLTMVEGVFSDTKINILDSKENRDS